jgi:hypothetical protein
MYLLRIERTNEGIIINYYLFSDYVRTTNIIIYFRKLSNTICLRSAGDPNEGKNSPLK